MTVRKDDLYSLPAHLPAPVDDGACDHLRGAPLPAIALVSTRGELVRLDLLPGRTVVYAYPRTGLPNQDTPPGWDAIPGARGCTPQTCAYRDHHAELRALGAEVFGLSTQTTEYQRELVERLQLPFAVLSDAGFELTRALRLPTFEFDGVTLLKRHTLVVRDSRIEHVFYPVFPSDADAGRVIAWLRERR
jgi:peroxiredoxin